MSQKKQRRIRQLSRKMFTHCPYCKKGIGMLQPRISVTVKGKKGWAHIHCTKEVKKHD